MEMKKILNDLSYSKLVDLIQNDKDKGREILVAIVQEYEIISERKKSVERELSNLKNVLSDLKSGADNILQHLNVEKPVAIIMDKEFAVFSDISMSIERNVL